MTLKEYNERLEKVLRDTETRLGNTMVKLGSEALTLVRQRVQETGKNAEGQRYPNYSSDPMLTNCSAMTTSACSRIAGSKNKRKELQWVTLKRSGKNIKLFELKQGYKQFRELHGRRTDFVDFTFTGKMWGNMHILSSKSDHDNGTVIVGPTTEEEMNKLKGNVNRRGQILDLSRDEITQLSNDFKIDIVKIFKDNGL